MDSTLQNLNELNEKLRVIEQRLTHIENHLRLSNEPIEEEDNNPPLETTLYNSEEEMEMRIGKVWLPKLGIFAFLIGVAFYLTLPLIGIHPVIPPLGAYFVSIGILLIALKVRKGHPELSGILFGGSAGIAYMGTLRLHFFTEAGKELISNIYLEFVLLLLVAITILIYGYRHRSIFILCLGSLLAYVGALITDSAFVLIPVIILISCFQVIISVRFDWKGLLVFGILFSNIFHLSWAVNNPLIGKPFEISPSAGSLVVFMLLYSLIFSIGILKRKNNQSEELADTMITLLNAVVGYVLFFLLTLMSKTVAFPIYHLLASGVFITMACIFWVKERSKDITYILAMTGYAALSVAIISQFEQPNNYILLCFQSMLVLSTAIWFRSKFIIITNFFILWGTLGAYIFYKYDVNALALSFGVVGLLSARILNWKKNSLDFSTEKFRDLYLLITLILFPYTFYWIFPGMYAGFSMLILALLYFGISKLLRNLKYRYMSVLTLVISAGYLIIFGFTKAEVSEKITSFIVAGIVLTLVSFVYSRMKKSS